jgi:hypothetical protein
MPPLSLELKLLEHTPLSEYKYAVLYRIGSVAMLWGYLRSWALGLSRYDDVEFRRFLRSYQNACLRMGKRAATARVDNKRAHLWHARHPR